MKYLSALCLSLGLLASTACHSTGETQQVESAEVTSPHKVTLDIEGMT